MAVNKCQDHRKITVASLCSDTGEAKTVSTEPIEQWHSYESKTRSTRAAVWVRRHHLECPDTAVTLPSLLSVHSSDLGGSGLATRPSCVGHFDIANSSNGTRDAIGFTNGARFPSNRTTDDPSIIHTNADQQPDGTWSMAVPLPSTPFTTPGSSNVFYTNHKVDPRVRLVAQRTMIQLPQRVPRPARPPYTEEQELFIMYHRIFRELSWPEIEDKFARFFDFRTGDGLTSVYYRIRKNWGMQKVSKSKSCSVGDRSKVEARARRFSRDFLEKLGCFD